MKIFNKFLCVLLLTISVSATSKVADIVDTHTFTGQTSADNTVTLFTPSTTGVYRVSVYLDFATSISNTTALVHFTSVNGSATSTQACSNTNQSGANSCTILIRAIASNSITLEIITGNPTPNYDLYVVTEQII